MNILIFKNIYNQIEEIPLHKELFSNVTCPITSDELGEAFLHSIDGSARCLYGSNFKVTKQEDR